jgi:hypothetical protein
MLSRIFRTLPAILAFAFSVVAFAFSILALSSKNWAVRDNYDVTLNTEDWKTPIYTLHRSPFIICGAAATTTNITTTYEISCHKFKPFGFNQTSCELAVATQDDTAANLGDARLCQQIHYAGNFGIASTVFIGLAFLLTTFMTLSTFHLIFFPGKTPEEVENPREENLETKDRRKNHRARPHRGHPGYRRSVIGPCANLSLTIFLAVGVITAVISQFYGILGLIQSMPNNADFASSAAGSNDNVNTNGSHGPWYQGKALSVYATVAWGFALASGAVAGRIWRLPKWERVL